jgi:DNA-binding MarR family transcriptional regulator
MSLSWSANGAHSPIANAESRKAASKTTVSASLTQELSNAAGLAVALILRSCHLQLMDTLRLALQHSDVTNSQYFLLCCFLGRPERRASPSELADETGETRSNTTRICETFVQRGWLQRAHNVDDRRRVDMTLTQAGIQFTEGLIARVKACKGSAEVVLSAREYAETLRVLVRLSTALGNKQRA